MLGQTDLSLVPNRQANYFIQNSVSFFEIDPLGRIWVVDTHNYIHLYDPEGNKKYSFTDSLSGKISSIDVSHPSRALVFYADSAKLLFLGPTLNQVESIHLKESKKYLHVSAAALSDDQQIWIYDEQWQRIFKITSTFDIIKETTPLNDLGLSDFKPVSLSEKANLLLAAMPGQGFVVFDNSGQFKNRIVFPDMINYQFEGNKILVQNTKGVAIQAINPPTPFNLPMPKGLSKEPYKQIRLTKDRWYIAYENGITWLAK